jgi:hypothetical protein
MRTWARANTVAVTGAIGGILLMVWLGLTDWAWNDYGTEARPAFDALVHGQLLQFLKLAPAYGGSLVMRAPFVLIPRLWGGGELAIYRAAAAPCLIATAVLGVWLVANMRSRGATRIARAVALILCVANPITLAALEAGHPEELLGAALCVAAVIAATRNHGIWAGVLLGLAIANDEWALVAVGPVLMALPDRRMWALSAAAAVAGAIMLPLFIAGDLGTQLKGAASPTTSSSIFTPWQLWWFVGPHVHVIPKDQPWNLRFDPHWLTLVAHPLIVAISAPVTIACAALRSRGRPRPRNEPLLLLALLLLLRCALDPWDNTYYALPFLLALLAWEALSFARPPVVAVIASLAAWFVFQWAVPSHGVWPNAQALIFLAFVVPALGAVSLALFTPGLAERLSLRFRLRAMLPTPA